MILSDLMKYLTTRNVTQSLCNRLACWSEWQ